MKWGTDLPPSKKDEDEDRTLSGQHIEVKGPFGTGIKGPVWVVLALLMGVGGTGVVKELAPQWFALTPAQQQKADADVAQQIGQIDHRLASLERQLAEHEKDYRELMTGENGQIPGAGRARMQMMERRWDEQYNQLRADLDRVENDVRELRRRVR